MREGYPKLFCIFFKEGNEKEVPQEARRKGFTRETLLSGCAVFLLPELCGILLPLRITVF